MIVARRIPSTVRRSRGLRAFTLVELMVAVTGGLFISIIVFAMARQGTRFYQQETRIAEATLAATIGMQRLRADIGRAGYMASNNIATDTKLCTPLATLNGVTLLQSLRSLQITQENNALITSNTDLTLGAASAIIPDQIQLAGAYQNADRFITGYLPQAPGAGATNIPILLQPGIGALVRYRYSSLATDTDRANLLQSLFPNGRAVRLVNQYGRVAYAIIQGTTATGGPDGNLPAVNLRTSPLIPLRGGPNSLCEFAGVGVEINVVNFVRYRIADVRREPNYGSLFGQLYASTANPWDTNRTELIREELDPATGAPFTVTTAGNGQGPAPPEIVAEYAVDLKFEVTYGATWPNPTQLITTSPTTSNTVYTIAGTGAGTRPESVRSVRVRLSVRSREADRAQAIPEPGLYRLGIRANGNGATTFARVRTLQADVAVPNHFSTN